MADPSLPSAGLPSALEKIIERLRSPVLLFGLGGGVVLLIAASVVTQSQAPLYLAAIVVLMLAALIVYGITKRGSVFAPKVEGRNVKADSEAVIAGQRGGGPAQIFKPVVKASEDVVAGPGAVVAGFSTGSPLEEKEPEKPGT